MAVATTLRSPAPYDLAAFGRLLDAHAGTAVRHVHFTGGEASLVPDLPAMIRLARARGVDRTSVTTNGTRPPRTYLDLVEAGIDEIRVSLAAARRRPPLPRRERGRAPRQPAAPRRHRAVPPRPRARRPEAPLRGGRPRRPRRLPRGGGGPGRPRGPPRRPARRRPAAPAHEGRRRLPPRRCGARGGPRSSYLREGGAPLGPASDPPEVQRARTVRFVREADCLSDPICRRYCLHCTRTFNVRANEARP